MIVSTLPGILFSPWIGAFIDGHNTRTICAVAELIRAVTWLAATALVQFQMIAMPIIYLAIFISAVCECFFQPAIGAMIRDIVPREHLLNANIFSNTSMQVGVSLGTFFGGTLVALLGATHSFSLIFGSFLISGLLIFSIDPRYTRLDPHVSLRNNGVLRDYINTARYIRNGNRLLLGLAILQIAVYSNAYVCNMLLPIFVNKELNASAASFGIIDASWGWGSIIGGLILPFFTHKINTFKINMLGLFCMAIVLTTLSFSKSTFQSSLAYLIIGFFNCIMRITVDTVMLNIIEPGYYSKIKSSVMMLISCLSLFIYAGLAYTGETLSTRWLYRIDALVLILVVLFGLCIALLIRRSKQ